ncbi:multiple epidermal growth factor-like domains protein 6 [Haliotis rubra]|uniref:multiple epidermal growth factor-like domains protein 6 n=1 Tax=Haliotis rubra TaxID=36100 RepID=UPI001EE5A35D|nr:multiple epidermal growth factor-like domains protein 6 [Haliotis rubra]
MELCIPLWFLFLLESLLLDRGTGHPVDSCRDQYPQECRQYVTRTLCDHPGITPACRHTCAACVDPVAPCEDPKRWGQHCDNLCNVACSGRRCHRMSGYCHGSCWDGLYGLACELHCENCMNGHCNRVGTCLSGCKPGWRGTRCDQND